MLVGISFKASIVGQVF